MRGQHDAAVGERVDVLRAQSRKDVRRWARAEPDVAVAEVVGQQEHNVGPATFRRLARVREKQGGGYGLTSEFRSFRGSSAMFTLLHTGTLESPCSKDPPMTGFRADTKLLLNQRREMGSVQIMTASNNTILGNSFNFQAT